MADREKVIAEFEDIQKSLNDGHGVAITDKSELVRDTLELLKDQQNIISALRVINDGLTEAILEQKQIIRCKDCEIAKRLYAKPIDKSYECDDPTTSMSEGAWYVCENCGKPLMVVSEFICKKCGAKILWDEKLLRSFDKYEDWLNTP